MDCFDPSAGPQLRCSVVGIMTFHTALRPGSGQASVAERRRHPRAQLNLPVRLRWLGPLGQLTEVAETLDVCRGGLLVYRRDPAHVGSMLWATFPFDSSLQLPQPEIPARVARVKDTPVGGHLVAIEFEAPLRHTAGTVATSLDRRRHERIPLALPVRVRLSDSPWPEETMTVDVSGDGVLFCTARLYSVDDLVYVNLPPGTIWSRSSSTAEVPARVVRVVRRPDSVEQQVAVALLPGGKP